MKKSAITIEHVVKAALALITIAIVIPLLFEFMKRAGKEITECEDKGGECLVKQEGENLYTKCIKEGGKPSRLFSCAKADKKEEKKETLCCMFKEKI